ncbi:MAG: hypothetical protein GXO46_06995, partial [Chlorobi bacterium]|nr:hypothetical protein [Chlorobiota bacterium]
MASQSNFIVLNLALKDLRHEWILTACLIMAISAVLSPLLLLFGLKYGIIDWGTKHLVNDPRYREIRPNISKSFDKNWFDTLKNRDDVAFVVPMTREISATIKAHVKGHRSEQELNIIPTMAGDPLLLENGARIPGNNECVISSFAAKSLNVKPGDILVASAGRIIKGQYEYGTFKLKVAGILAERATQQKSIYVPLSVLEAVERYKDGQAVPEYGWPGSIPTAYPVFDGIIIVLSQKMTRLEQLMLCNNTGFTKIKQLEPDELQAKAGFTISPGMIAYHLFTLHKPAGMESIEAVKDKLRGKNANLFLWIRPITAKLFSNDKVPVADLTLYSLSSPPKKSKAVGLNFSTPWGENEGNVTRMIMLPPEIKVNGNNFFLSIEKEGRKLE